MPREGLEVVAEIEDAGYSGAYLDRPGLDRVRELLATHPALANSTGLALPYVTVCIRADLADIR